MLLTADMTLELILAGADIVKVGIGPEVCALHVSKQVWGIHN